MKKQILSTLLMLISIASFSQAQLAPIPVSGFKLPMSVTPPGFVMEPVTIKNMGTQTATFVFLNPIPGQENIYNYEDTLKDYLLHAGHFDDALPENDDTMAVVFATVEVIKNPVHENALHMANEWNQAPGAGNAPSDLVDSVRMRKYGPMVASTLYHGQCGDLSQMFKECLKLTGLFSADDLFGVSLGTYIDSDAHSCSAFIFREDTVFVDTDVNERFSLFRNPAKRSGYASPHDLLVDTSLITEDQAYRWPNPLTGDSMVLGYGSISHYRARFIHHLEVMPESFSERCFKTSNEINLSSLSYITFTPPQFPQDKYLFDMSDPVIKMHWDSIVHWGGIMFATNDTLVEVQMITLVKAEVALMIPYLTPDSALGVLVSQNFKKVYGEDLMPLDWYFDKVPTFTITIPPVNKDLILGEDVGIDNWVTHVTTTDTIELWTNTIVDSVSYLPKLWSQTGSAYATKEDINLMNHGRIKAGARAEFTVAYSPFIPNPSKGFKLGQGTTPDTLMINGVLMIDTPLTATVTVVGADYHMNVFPNPTTGKFQVVGLDDQKAIPMDVYDITGKKIVSYNLQNNNQQFDLSSFSSGIYLVKIGNQTKRIVLQGQ